MSETSRPDILGLTAMIVAAHVSHNQVPADALPGMIEVVYGSLVTAGGPKPTQASDAIPAVPIKRSVFPDFIVCLEDGRKLKTLKRHLRTNHGMTPAGYRAKWSLPSDYPMVAPAYAATRSRFAKSVGLGLKPPAIVAAPEEVAPNAPQITVSVVWRPPTVRSGCMGHCPRWCEI